MIHQNKKIKKNQNKKAPMQIFIVKKSENFEL